MFWALIATSVAKASGPVAETIGPARRRRRKERSNILAPQVRDRPEPFTRSAGGAFRAGAETGGLAVELYARRLSTCDIEEAFTDEIGKRLLSQAAVSEIAEWLWMEDEALCERGPSKRGVVRPLAERLRPGELREAALADCGVGDPLLVVSDGASAIPFARSRNGLRPFGAPVPA